MPQAPSPKPGSVSSVKSHFKNDSSVQQSITYKQSETTTQSFNWSVSEKLAIGLEVSVKAGLPAVAEVTTKFSTNLELSSTQGASDTKSQSWEVSQQVLCPPYSNITAQLNVHTAEYDISWTAETKLKGYVAIWFKNRFYKPGFDSDHHLYFIPIGKVIDDCIKNNIISTNGYKKVSSSTIMASSRGKFYGGQGTDLVVDIKETSLNKDMSIIENMDHIEYSIPIDESENQQN